LAKGSRAEDAPRAGGWQFIDRGDAMVLRFPFLVALGVTPIASPPSDLAGAARRAVKRLRKWASSP
jgi:hypothetical protein